MILEIYGNPETERRPKTWDLIRSLCREIVSPTLALGDFNEILNPNEKWGGRIHPEKQMEEFKVFLSKCDLRDLGFNCPPFT